MLVLVESEILRQESKFVHLDLAWTYYSRACWQFSHENRDVHGKVIVCRQVWGVFSHCKKREKGLRDGKKERT